LKKSQLQAYFQQIDFHPSIKLGQNFLIEESIPRKMVELAPIGSESHVVEIGPGVGIITRQILEITPHLHAIEKDNRLFGYLRDNFCEFQHMRLLHGDALDHPLADITEPDKCVVIANPPYSIIGPWLAAILSIALPDQLVLLIQKEVADRLTAQPRTKAYGALTIRLQAAYDISVAHRVSPQCFYPSPDVESAVVHLKRKHDAHRFDDAFTRIIQSLFTQRRKQVGSQLKANLDTAHIHSWEQTLSEYNLGMKARPEEIPVAGWIALDLKTRAT